MTNGSHPSKRKVHSPRKSTTGKAKAVKIRKTSQGKAGGKFADRQPESLSDDEWQEVAATINEY